MTAPTFTYTDHAETVKNALRKAFGDNTTIVTNEGYLGRVHVKIVSEQLNGKTERQKQEYLWDILRTELKDEAEAVSLVVGYGTDEL